MRIVPIFLLCLVTGACASLDAPPPEPGPQPGQAQLTAGIASGISDSHFAKPIEITDLLPSPASYEEPWMICIRSASPDETRHVTYSVFWGTNFGTGLTGQFVKSRYSVFADNCDAQTYHPYTAPVAPSASPSPSPTPEPKRYGRHHQ